MTSNNPFSEEKSSQPFIWTKKLNKESQQTTEERVRENQLELAKLEKERLKREDRREQLREEKDLLRRVKEAEHYHEWEKQEDSFHYNQIRLRSKIRINDGRAKPIDLLAYYINDDDHNSAVEMHEPSTYLNGLTIRDLEDLLVDIRVYTQLEEQQKSEKESHHYDDQYWRDITTITEDELLKLRRLSSQLYKDQKIDDRREGINSAVLQDVTETIKNKTSRQLEQLEQRIRCKIENDTEIDVGYWESLLSQLQAHLARARLRDRHQITLKRKLQKIKQEQGIFHASSISSSATPTIPKKKQDHENNPLDSFNDYDDEIEPFEDFETKCIRDYEQGRFSPILAQINDLDLEVQKRCTDEIDDWDKLKQQRESVTRSAFEALVRSMGSLSSDDSLINTGIPMDVQCLWSDKYRPRKPRVFNKVHTGYDWNQYNKKHYDTDNPPPKTVQGYKFNIFYPDLIDKTKTPSYNLTVCEDNRDFSILKFHAGPPYEDIAFKILGFFYVVENVQEKNHHEAYASLFFPKKSWRTKQEYEHAEATYGKELAKGQLISDHVDQEEEKMIELKIKHDIRGKSINEDDDRYDGGSTQADGSDRNVEAIIQVTNLSKEIKEQGLRDWLISFGSVSRIYLAEDTSSDTPKSPAVIIFNDKNDAQKVIEDLSGMRYGVLMLKVGSASEAKGQ